MYFLALRAASLGTQAVLRRRSNLARSINRFKKERAGLIASLRSTPTTQSGAFPPHVPSSYAQLLRLTAVLRSTLVLQAVTKVYLDDDSNRRGMLMFYRLQAVLMTRAVDPREEGGGGWGPAGSLVLCLSRARRRHVPLRWRRRRRLGAHPGRAYRQRLGPRAHRCQVAPPNALP